MQKQQAEGDKEECEGGRKMFSQSDSSSQTLNRFLLKASERRLCDVIVSSCCGVYPRGLAANPFVRRLQTVKICFGPQHHRHFG